MNSQSSHRLLVGPERWARLRNLPDVPSIRIAAAQLDALTERWATDFLLNVDETRHNWHLIRARDVQTRAISLAVQFGRTGDARFLRAVCEYIRQIAGWEYWSWILWRQSDTDQNDIFDLSYGENSFTLALIWDWLGPELPPDTRDLLISAARTRAFTPFLERNGTPGKEMWYYRKPDCNWNTVCNGGAGMLALALSEHCPEGERVLEIVEQSIRPYFEFLKQDGAWPEGIGYWGYGHRYGYWYLLSREAVDRAPHPLLELPGSRATLRFPLLFSPHGIPCSFGDVNSFFALPFHMAAAERYGLDDVLAELDARFTRRLHEDPAALNDEHWPCIAELLLLHPGRIPAAPAADRRPFISIQDGVEWSIVSDRRQDPRLYAAVRGGTTDAPHTHQDLLSIFVVAGGERMITNVSALEYLDTTFSPRRFEVFENCAHSKSTLLANGVGMPQPAFVKTTRIAGAGWEGVLLDGTEKMEVGSQVKAFGRAVVILHEAALLIVDRVVLSHPGCAEARFYTEQQASVAGNSALLRGKQAQLHLAFASNVDAVMQTAIPTPTDPAVEPPRAIRWAVRGLHTDMVLATLLTPGGPGDIAIDPEARVIRIVTEKGTIELRYEHERLGIRNDER